jgi:hypothetical protein
MIRPALKATVDGEYDNIPAAIKSALTKFIQLASLGKKSLANVVLPTPLGPAIMMIF